MTEGVSASVKKAVESFNNAWEMGCFYKVIEAAHHEVDIALKEKRITKELYESTKEKIEALRYIAATTTSEALKHKAINNAAELESHLKKMEVIMDSKA